VQETDTSAQVSGTEGYASEAEQLFQRYESVRAAENHRHVLHLIPRAPARVLDIGSGTGRDAAWFATFGHRVIAVEPTDALRIPAMALHPSPLIEWLDDSLPDLVGLRSRGETFDLVMLTAVWMQSRPNPASICDAESGLADWVGRHYRYDDPAWARTARAADV
jgi:protein-L-isoaspartate O-methyltransferase